MLISATQLRSHLYKVLHNISLTGEPVEVDLKGTRFIISPAEITSRRLENLRPHPQAVNLSMGLLDDLAESPAWDADAWDAKSLEELQL